MAAAHVGSCSSSVRRFSRLEEEEEKEEEHRGRGAGGFFVIGGVEVEGAGSRPADRERRKLGWY